MNEFHVSFPFLNWNFTINRVAFSVGTFSVYWYGLIIATGLMLAILYARFTAPRFQLNFSKLMNCVIVGLITGIIGARLYFCLFKWDYYSAHPVEILYIHEGGLAIYGGIIGALAGGLIVAKVQKMRFLPILDVVMLGFLIGQGLGRWGNFFNQEAYGTA
ncbi:MAG: prolipoprotein diacylglyceryl transferase, partial [Ruminococcus sp.]|nr:prolipoprotein diacylglyceryl transferase [Ruminococcus sp.]